MKTAAVVIESWKLPIFKRHLEAAGYSYTEGPGLTQDTLILVINFEWLAKLEPVVRAANQEAWKARGSPGINECAPGA